MSMGPASDKHSHSISLHSDLINVRRKNTSIPVNVMTDEAGTGIAIERITIKDVHTIEKATLNTFEEANQSHRHDAHSFFLLENGTVFIELDFQQYKIKAPSIIYIHPDQVHYTRTFKNVTVSCLSISNENLHAEYRILLKNITPAKPLMLEKETFSILCETVALCIKFSERKTDKLHHSLLKDSCNTLVALIIAQYLEQSKPTDKPARFEIVTKNFREILEHNYTTAKRPAIYAQQLHLSTAYLNECVKNATGNSVSHHIQQRVLLEAKRLLSYSDKTVKEIATALGYDDYPYFSRFFTKATGMTAVAFRNKNHD